MCSCSSVSLASAAHSPAVSSSLMSEAQPKATISPSCKTKQRAFPKQLVAQKCVTHRVCVLSTQMIRLDSNANPTTRKLRKSRRDTTPRAAPRKVAPKRRQEVRAHMAYCKQVTRSLTWMRRTPHRKHCGYGVAVPSTHVETNIEQDCLRHVGFLTCPSKKSTTFKQIASIPFTFKSCG